MQIDESKITARVYTMLGNAYLVSLAWEGLGMYTHSFKVMPSKFAGQKWWVTPPKYYIASSKEWISPFEFEKGSAIWQIIEKRCIEAVETKLNMAQSTDLGAGKDALPTDDEVDYINDHLDEELDRIFTEPDEGHPP